MTKTNALFLSHKDASCGLDPERITLPLVSSLKHPPIVCVQNWRKRKSGFAHRTAAVFSYRGNPYFFNEPVDNYVFRTLDKLQWYQSTV